MTQYIMETKTKSTNIFNYYLLMAGCIYYPHKGDEDNWKIQVRGKKLRNVAWTSRRGVRNTAWKSRGGVRNVVLLEIPGRSKKSFLEI